MTVVFIEIELYQGNGSKVALRADDIIVIREMDGGTRIVMRSGGIFDTSMAYEEVKNLITTACKD